MGDGFSTDSDDLPAVVDIACPRCGAVFRGFAYGVPAYPHPPGYASCGVLPEGF